MAQRVLNLIHREPDQLRYLGVPAKGMGHNRPSLFLYKGADHDIIRPGWLA